MLCGTLLTISTGSGGTAITSSSLVRPAGKRKANDHGAGLRRCTAPLEAPPLFRIRARGRTACSPTKMEPRDPGGLRFARRRLPVQAETMVQSRLPARSGQARRLLKRCRPLRQRQDGDATPANEPLQSSVAQITRLKLRLSPVPCRIRWLETGRLPLTLASCISAPLETWPSG
jgi:hypothetical protein